MYKVTEKNVSKRYHVRHLILTYRSSIMTLIKYKRKSDKNITVQIKQ